MKKYNYNFSLITPGGCSSKCSFCTDPYNEAFSPDYMKNFIELVGSRQLPRVFNQISVTGGEPTQSPHFLNIMNALYFDSITPNPQFTKRVLTTNGWKLPNFLTEVGRTFHHVNISRHAIGDKVNYVIFGGKNIATDKMIAECCAELGKVGVDVNLNLVYSEGNPLDITYVKGYIAYAQSLNATKVTFRYDQNTNLMTPSFLEQSVIELGYKPVEEGGCPVCREACYLINGMYVTFKNACAEPTAHLEGELYELIYHVDGKVYKDWAKRLPYDPANDKVQHTFTNKDVDPVRLLLEDSAAAATRDLVHGVGECNSWNLGSGGCGRYGSGRC